MKLSIRESFLYWLAKKCGIPMERLLPKWLAILSYVIMPERLQWAWEQRGYNPMTDTYTFHGARLSRQFLICLTGPTPEGFWFRVVKVESGTVTMERRVFQDEQTSEKEGAAHSRSESA